MTKNSPYVSEYLSMSHHDHFALKGIHCDQAVSKSTFYTHSQIDETVVFVVLKVELMFGLKT